MQIHKRFPFNLRHFYSRVLIFVAKVTFLSARGVRRWCYLRLGDHSVRLKLLQVMYQERLCKGGLASAEYKVTRELRALGYDGARLYAALFAIMHRYDRLRAYNLGLLALKEGGEGSPEIVEGLRQDLKRALAAPPSKSTALLIIQAVVLLGNYCEGCALKIEEQRYFSGFLALCDLLRVEEGKTPEKVLAWSAEDNALFAAIHKLAEGSRSMLQELVNRIISSSSSDDTRGEWGALNLLTFILTEELPYAAMIPLQRMFSLYPTPELASDLCSRFIKLGHFTIALPYAEYISRESGNTTMLERVNSWLRLLRHGFELPVRREFATTPRDATEIVYVLNNSLPVTQNGYAIRSHMILLALREIGYQMRAVTRLGFPRDLASFGLGACRIFDEVQDVRYDRLLSHRCSLHSPDRLSYLREYGERLAEYVRSRRAFLLHAASNYVNGLAAAYAASKLGLPFIYSVRGFWEITRASLDPAWQSSEQCQIQTNLETYVAKAADVVIAITEGLKQELVRRGIPEQKIMIIPNGVDTERFHPRARDRELEIKLGIEGKVVIGYVGSVVDYEGLDSLMRACGELLRRGQTNFKLLIVGSGAALNSLRALTQEMGLQEYVLLTGSVPHDQIERYYSVIDIAPLPRLPLPVCELVSPLKPFEMMAMGKALLCSDVQALKEIVRSGETGLLFRKGDEGHMAEQLYRLVVDENLRRALGENARRWVVCEREWRVLVKQLADIYETFRPKGRRHEMLQVAVN